MSAVRLLVCCLCVLVSECFFNSGPAGQPKAFLTGADREACVCSSEVGTRIQGVPREHRWLHEPSGMKYPRSSLPFARVLDLFLAGQH